jgi:glutaminyl-peptide cyclotransferase
MKVDLPVRETPRVSNLAARSQGPQRRRGAWRGPVGLWLGIIALLGQVGCARVQPEAGNSAGAAQSAPGPTKSNGNPQAGTKAGPGPVAQQTPPPAVQRFDVRIVRTYPHDPAAFTQGLLFRDGALFESAGQYGSSSLRHVDLESGTVLRRVDFATSPALAPLGSSYFAEGLTAVGNQLYQLTWKEHVCFIWDLQSFELLGRFSYSGEGWGLCHDGNRLILSDGQPYLRFFEVHPDRPGEYRENGRLLVTYNNQPVDKLNELEWVDGQVWANRWQSNEVLRIDPATGRVVGLIDCRPLVEAVALIPDVPVPGFGPQNVLNGIAYDPIGRRLFLTGKNWPKLFEIEVITRP